MLKRLVVRKHLSVSGDPMMNTLQGGTDEAFLFLESVVIGTGKVEGGLPHVYLFSLNLVSAWIPIEEVGRRVFEDVPSKELSDESEEELSVHEGSESKGQHSVDNQDFSDSGDSNFDNHGNGMKQGLSSGNVAGWFVDFLKFLRGDPVKVSA
ncbi:hypothetical protein P5673_025068 [Acropora cervicornis]|uniref:Uncharacterized protein n=1 Tax=Acropora cervicornis TaxID=6130 RepID=A0AAD9UXP4_ACRCE|nr:hypothetical protein P5673_025068 [Acropora cervicornis]